MNRGEVFRTSHRVAERGDKPGFYVIVSRGFFAGNEDIPTVICAPVYGEVLGLATEAVVGPEDGVPRTSAVLASADVTRHHVFMEVHANLLSLKGHHHGSP